MAKLFDKGVRIIPTWLAVAQHLLARGGAYTDSNLVLEITDPRTISEEDRKLMRSIDALLESKDKYPLRTVAGTIFPLDLYKRYQRPAFYDEYLRVMKCGKVEGTWGTYAHRMMSREGKTPSQNINPLERIVQRISDAGQPDGKSFKNSYELSVANPKEDFAEVDLDIGGELPTYDVNKDGNRWYGFPCLSHVSFKRVRKDGGFAVDLTAVYRSHRYCERALGNLLGLAQLQWFVAREAKVQIGTLTCVSTHAALDFSSWGGVRKTRQVLTTAS